MIKGHSIRCYNYKTRMGFLIPGSILLCGLIYCILGWITINGEVNCYGSMHLYVNAIAIYGTVLLVLYASLFLFSRAWNVKYNNVFIYEHTSFFYLTTIINLVIFVIGIILLCTVFSCKDTFYYVVTIVFVVLSGLCFFNLLEQRNGGIVVGSVV
jgi:hypothetical protein